MKSFTFIKDSIPIAASFFVFFCITKAMIFYSAFGIRILDFITFSESLLLFFDDILILVIPVLFAVGYLYIAANYIGKKFIFEKKYTLFVKLLAYGLIILYLVCLYKLFTFYFEFTPLFTWGYLYISLLIAIIPFQSIFYKFRQQREEFKQHDHQRALILLQRKIVKRILIWTLSISIVGGGIQKLYQDLKGTFASNQNVVKCEFSNGITISSNQDTLYIGRVTNYIFFYLPKSKKSIIYKADNLILFEKVQLKKNTQKPFDYF